MHYNLISHSFIIGHKFIYNTLIILICHRKPKIFVEDFLFPTSKLNGRWWVLDLPVYIN